MLKKKRLWHVFRVGLPTYSLFFISLMTEFKNLGQVEFFCCLIDIIQWIDEPLYKISSYRKLK